MNRHPFTRPGQVSPDLPAPDNCVVCGGPEAAHLAAGADQRVTSAREYLTGIRQHKVSTLPPSVMLRECAELRRQLGQVLDVIDQAAGMRDALAAVREAIDIPHPATVGDGETYDRILLERVGHARIMLGSILDPARTHSDVPWQVGYLRERLAEVPATGYKTWLEAVAERKAAEGDAP